VKKQKYNIQVFAAGVLSLKETPGGYFKMKLAASGIAKAARPGQFISLQVNASGMPLMRRPMGIFSANKGAVEILFKAAGKGTEMLSRKKQGESVSVLGPLGNGFSVREELRHAILVAGGYGVSPIAFLYEELRKRKITTTVIIGAKNKKLIFKEGFSNPIITTEDGSEGFKGLVTERLDAACAGFACGSSAVFACGPVPMLKAAAEVSEKHGIECQVSMESLMACGVGVCLSCVCAVKEGMDTGYKRICADGPVFDSREIVWRT